MRKKIKYWVFSLFGNDYRFGGDQSQQTRWSPLITTLTSQTLGTKEIGLVCQRIMFLVDCSVDLWVCHRLLGPSNIILGDRIHWGKACSWHLVLGKWSGFFFFLTIEGIVSVLSKIRFSLPFIVIVFFHHLFFWSWWYFLYRRTIFSF